MKKIFPVIVVLVTLSLLGTIVMQLSWFHNLLLVQQERIVFSVDKAGYGVTQEMSKQASPMMRLQRKPMLKLTPGDLSFSIIKPSNISQRYTVAEVNDKIKKAFDREGLKNLRYEFAITYGQDEYLVEMQSPGYFVESMDTNHYKQRVVPILPDGETNVSGEIPYEHLWIILPEFKTQVWRSLIWMIIGSVLFTLIIITAFYLTVKTMLNQRKLSLIKSDFINNMTHELKTPLATISLAVDALKNDKVQNDPDKRSYFSGIIKEENKRMNKHVETILQAATMDKQELKLNFQPLHVHEIIQKVLENFTLQLNDKNANVSLLLNARNDLVQADEVHFTNLLNNLVDNAVKYSKEELLITITTHSTNNYLVVQVQDNGIGMSKETVKRIFEKFYRAHTGNLHNVKGFGLGMSYVKTVIDAHKGKIKVDSSVGKGSTFTIDMPLSKA